MFMHDKANKESHIFKKLRQIQQLLKIGEKNLFFRNNRQLKKKKRGSLPNYTKQIFCRKHWHV